MTQNRAADAADDDDSLGVLDDAASSLDTAGVGILGSTAQVNVTLPRDEDDDLADDEVVDGEILSDLVIEDLVIEPVDAAAAAAATDETPSSSTPGESAPAESAPAESSSDESPLDKSPSDKGAEPTKSAAPAGGSAKTAAESLGAAAKSTASTAKSAASAKNTGPTAKNTAPAAKSAATPSESTKAASPQATSFKTALSQGAPAKGTSAPAPSPRLGATAQSTPAQSTPAQGTPAGKPATPRTASSVVAPSAAASAPAEKAKTVNTNQEHQPEIVLTSKRLGELGEASRESADLLTADRLLDPHRVTKPEPEGAWSHFLYTISGRRINIGDGKRARARKALSARIAAPLTGGARFVPVLSRKGGVGKTTITTLLGMALADARDDRVIAVDANPDRGTLAERIVRSHSKSVRDLVRIHDDVRGYHDISAIVARDATRLDVLASDSDPRIAEAFDDSDYRHVAEVAAHYYSLVLTDTGTGIVHSVMGATLDHADQLVIVSGLSVDEARLASETLTWLETNGHAELAREAIIVLNQSTPGSPLVRLNELEAHFSTRAKHVMRMPYDAQIAGGGAIVFANLQPETRQAARELAALLVEGLRAKAS